MTKADKEFVEMTAKLTAQETVKESRATLECATNGNRIGELEQVVNNGIKERADRNEKGIAANRKFIFWSILGLFLVMIGGITLSYFGG